jgi:hypothetical protein
MRRVDRSAGDRGGVPSAMAMAVPLALALLAALPASAFAKDELPPRWRAPLALSQPAPFVEVALPPSTYAHSEGRVLSDLRVVDAQGRRVPFALIPPLAASAPRVEQRSDATLYPLPRPATSAPGALPVDATASYASPVELVVQPGTGSVTVRPVGGGPVVSATSPGWLFDLGAPREGPAPQHLELSWSGPTEFSIGYALATSDDLRQWRAAGSGQLLSVTSSTGTLTQSRVELPPASARFVRLVWTGLGARPVLTGAQAVATLASQAVPTDLTTLEPAAIAASAPAAVADAAARPSGLEVDLGGAMPVETVALRFRAGTHVAPTDVYGRDAADGAWRLLVRGVFERVERGDGVATSTPLTVHDTVRWLRFAPDARATALDPASVGVVLQVRPAHVVFAMQGDAPFSLLVGSRNATAAALPVETLVPVWRDERQRLGRASVGAWGEDAAAARAAESSSRWARVRGVLLWSVLLVGVAMLGTMVWRLTKLPPEG